MAKFEKFPKDGYAYSAADVGLALAGLIRREGSGPRSGMLSEPAVSAVPASWKVQVGAFWFVSNSAGSVAFSGLSAAEQVDIEPATAIPAGQARIDNVVWDYATEQLSVVQGTVSASPSAPSLPANCAGVCHVRVNSGDGTVVASQVTKTFKRTALVGQSDDVPWTNAPMNPVGGAPRVRYRMENDIVEIIGRGVKAAGSYAMFQLPSGMRFASGAMRFPTEHGREIEITSNGWVACTDQGAVSVTFNIRYPRV